MPRSLENTDYFATAKIAKLPTSNAISNTFQNYNLIRRNIEAVTTRRSWKFVGQADGKIPKPLENTDYFATAKIAKLPTSNAISNTFQIYNLIRRNIEAVTTRRSWKPFAQKARGFESLFLRQIKGQPSPKSSVVFLFLWLRYERILTPLCDSSSRRMGFAFERKPSGSLLTSGGAKKSSPEANTPLPSLLYKLEFDAPSNWKLFIKPF